jgi:uncharacterized protein involved in tolerance to divalent cations
MEYSKEILKLAKKLQDKNRRKIEQMKERIRSKHPYADPETLEYDQAANKYIIIVTCVKCEEKHSRYQQDLTQCQGICESCRSELIRKARRARSELIRKALAELSSEATG